MNRKNKRKSHMCDAHNCDTLQGVLLVNLHWRPFPLIYKCLRGPCVMCHLSTMHNSLIAWGSCQRQQWVLTSTYLERIGSFPVLCSLNTHTAPCSHHPHSPTQPSELIITGIVFDKCYASQVKCIWLLLNAENTATILLYKISLVWENAFHYLHNCAKQVKTL
jgi:hypothetical protein